MNSDFTFLTEEQIFGASKLDILKKYGTKCAVTDFSILLGAYAQPHNYDRDSYTSDGISKENRSTSWWTKTVNQNELLAVLPHGKAAFPESIENNGIGVGARPAIPYSSISTYASNATRGKNGVLEVEYGEYPQTMVSKDLAENIEEAYLCGKIKQTQKTYTIASYIDFDGIEKTTVYNEFEYKGRKFVRMLLGEEVYIEPADYVWLTIVRTMAAILTKIGLEPKLPDGGIIKKKVPFWIEVEPIKWIVDENSNIALSKKAIFSGVPYAYEGLLVDKFETTIIKKFMDRYFSKDILTKDIILKEKQKRELSKSKYAKTKEPDGFNFERVPENDISRKSCQSCNLGAVSVEDCQLCNQKSITLNDVLNGNYTENDLQMNTSQIYATIMSLAQVDETNFERVREFVLKLGEEPCEIFDSLWMRGYDGRKEIVELAKMNNSNDGGRKR